MVKRKTEHKDPITNKNIFYMHMHITHIKKYVYIHMCNGSLPYFLCFIISMVVSAENVMM